MLDEFEGSGYTVKEFCEVSELSEATFYSWLRKCRKGVEEVPRGFAPFEVLPSVVPTSIPGLFAEIRGIRIYREISAEYLKALLV